MLVLTPMIAEISHKRYQSLALKVWLYALALVTHEITWRLIKPAAMGE